MPTVAASSAKIEFKYLMNVPPTSMDALRVRQVGASLIRPALMYFLSEIFAGFNVGFRLGARKIPERVVSANLTLDLEARSEDLATPPDRLMVQVTGAIAETQIPYLAAWIGLSSTSWGEPPRMGCDLPDLPALRRSYNALENVVRFDSSETL